MRTIINKSRNIILWHFRKLLLKYAFETCQDDKTLSLVVVVDNSEFDFAISLFYNCWLIVKDVRYELSQSII